MIDKSTTSVEEQGLPQVARVYDSDYKVVINRGASDGIKKGQRFLIFGVDSEIVDPASGNPLERLEIVKGTGKAVHVQETITTVESDMHTPTSRRVVRRKTPSHPLASSVFGLSQEEEEVYEDHGDRLPFDDPEEGDYAKPI